ncbi:chorismate synthase [Halanaerobium congolense]|jgi:chorismate synthase|uniref:Chorismate synthase n=1 Tax=Halanaerobium congolense TaxID=54121 RepID=A0A1M7LIQ4_9FIRM|nr:chorismate synthase [Halanaerobium congolense]KXS49821.1 MAG: chorismate synthase [Halanaerobium sp. T82-1]PUU91721.1 MAG: chorismate synthase [Halanaerobium sp.]PTX15843.1 chorismate synthase [Halanaerobium congolense]PXV70088.1 chorismate synthase [Halanaerobium congolense]TDP24147.1 chorismate synthase [Halanaerobium congolense]
MFEYLTAGESHGPRLTAVIKNLPAGLRVEVEKINDELYRRQQGYGRGNRMKIESDKIIINSGLRHKETLGTPLSMTIENKDWQNWLEAMAPDKERGAEVEALTNPRPGHADLPGALKYNHRDLRNVLERASARETAARTAVGAVARQFLEEFGVNVYSHVVQIGNLKSENWTDLKAKNPESFNEQEAINNYFEKLDQTPLRCGDSTKTEAMKNLIDSWRANGDSVGGVFEIVVTGLPVGLGSHVHWDLKLESKLAAQLMGIQAIKGVEIGSGFKGAGLPGSKAHDEIYYDLNKGFYRSSNQAGGIEGGMTNGEELIIRLAMKPIPTLAKALHSADIISKKERTAAKERSDVCAVPAASIVGEAVTAIVLAQSTADKFGGDSIKEIKRNYNSYLEQLKKF